MYTGQLDISEGSVPILVSTAQFLEMPLLEQLLQTHAVTSTTQSPTPTPPKPKINKTPARTSYSSGNQKIIRTPNKQELLPAGPSRIDLEVNLVLLHSYLCLAELCLFRWETHLVSLEVYPNYLSC